MPVEKHSSENIGWLRAGVLGANDGLISTSSLGLGVAAAEPTRAAIYVTRGLTPELAGEVASQLMAHDALGAHARDPSRPPSRRPRLSPAAPTLARCAAGEVLGRRGQGLPGTRRAAVRDEALIWEG